MGARAKIYIQNRRIFEYMVQSLHPCHLIGQTYNQFLWWHDGKCGNESRGGEFDHPVLENNGK